METHPYIDKSGFTNQLNLSDKYIETKGYEDGGIWFADTQKIICGTFPPTFEHQNRKGYIYYSSSRNKFWRHIDDIYKTKDKLFLPSKFSRDDKLRINNAFDKINFIKSKKLGFIDIFTKIDRKICCSSADEDLIPIETIFDNGTFERVMSSNVNQFIFVYKLSLNTFVESLNKKYKITPLSFREYNKDDIPLEIKTFKFNEKAFELLYSPIHGKIKDNLKQKALRTAIDRLSGSK